MEKWHFKKILVLALVLGPTVTVALADEVANQAAVSTCKNHYYSQAWKFIPKNIKKYSDDCANSVILPGKFADQVTSAKLKGASNTEKAGSGAVDIGAGSLKVDTNTANVAAKSENNIATLASMNIAQIQALIKENEQNIKDLNTEKQNALNAAAYEGASPDPKMTSTFDNLIQEQENAKAIAEANKQTLEKEQNIAIKNGGAATNVGQEAANTQGTLQTVGDTSSGDGGGGGGGSKSSNSNKPDDALGTMKAANGLLGTMSQQAANNASNGASKSQPMGGMAGSALGGGAANGSVSNTTDTTSNPLNLLDPQSTPTTLATATTPTPATSSSTGGQLVGALKDRLNNLSGASAVPPTAAAAKANPTQDAMMGSSAATKAQDNIENIKTADDNVAYEDGGGGSPLSGLSDGHTIKDDMNGLLSAFGLGGEQTVTTKNIDESGVRQPAAAGPAKLTNNQESFVAPDDINTPVFSRVSDQIAKHMAKGDVRSGTEENL